MKIDRKSGLALYQQVAQQLVTAIADATYPVGSLIPSESQLANTLHVSRAVIRQAIDQLVRSGVVARVPGKGTFVVGTVAQPSSSSRQPQNARSGLIGALVSYLDSARPSELMETLWEIARGRGYDIIIAATENSLTLQEENIRRLLAKGVEGLVIVPVESEVPDSIFVEMAQSNFPICLMDRNVPEIGLDAVLTDNEGAGYLATRHLLELGHRRIAILSRPISPVLFSDRRLLYASAAIHHSAPTLRAASARGYR
jgi:GntR family transcriptional regulator of arabinose operon